MLSEPPRCRPFPVLALKGADSPRGLHRGHSPGHMSPPGARSTGGGWLLPASWPDPNSLRQVNPDHDERYRGATPLPRPQLPQPLVVACGEPDCSLRSDFRVFLRRHDCVSPEQQRPDHRKVQPRFLDKFHGALSLSRHNSDLEAAKLIYLNPLQTKPAI